MPPHSFRLEKSSGFCHPLSIPTRPSFLGCHNWRRISGVLDGQWHFTESLGFLYLSLRGPLHWIYPPKLIWPRKENALSYVELFAANGSMFFLFWLSYQWLHEAPLLALTLAVPSLSLLFVFLKLRPFPRLLHRFGRAQSFIVAAVILTF